MTGITHDPAVRQCIDDCLQCRTTCLGMAMGHCLERQGAHSERGHLTLMLNCAELCGTAAHFMLAGSTLHTEVCALCATVCGACAQSCRQLDGMEHCVAACERCAASCRTVSGVQAPGVHASDQLPTTGVTGGPPRQGAYG
ncbi:four-helix bundle copper-binding protein [Caldimonas thermodepolymerans]|uniref:four-helix bundle copper-binding protein n=1 Tax=Caldimonas thermodepolymerans TaxID=215580 RepID=UPI0022363DBE|nr:four-helix bundle copper-binding protein [Caldimonas thermodepolymerans]UZG42657.1 four-helix bundle copper-binding protein [Caldimonas thermodepolymerans]